MDATLETNYTLLSAIDTNAADFHERLAVLSLRGVARNVPCLAQPPTLPKELKWSLKSTYRIKRERISYRCLPDKFLGVSREALPFEPSRELTIKRQQATNRVRWRERWR